MMDEEELWLSHSVDEEEERFLSSQEPSAFGLALTYKGGLAGGMSNTVSFNVVIVSILKRITGYHVRNRPGERQRATVSAFQGGSGRKPAFTVSCKAKAIIHGFKDENYGKRATLLVYELKFLSGKGIRIKEADILFEFKKGSESDHFPQVAVGTSFPTSVHSHRPFTGPTKPQNLSRCLCPFCLSSLHF